MILPKIGELVEAIDIVNVTAPYRLDGSGKIISTFCSNIPAKIEPVGGQLSNQTQETEVYTQNYRIWIRYRRGIMPFQQITWGGARLVITAPPEQFRNYLLINAQETTFRNI